MQSGKLHLLSRSTEFCLLLLIRRIHYKYIHRTPHSSVPRSPVRLVLNEIFPKSPRPCLSWTIIDRFRMFRSFPFENTLQLVQQSRISVLCLVQVGLPIVVFILTLLTQANIHYKYIPRTPHSSVPRSPVRLVLNEIFSKSPLPCLLWTIFDRFRMFRSFPFENALELVQHTRISILCLVQVGLPIVVFIMTPLAQANIHYKYIPRTPHSSVPRSPVRLVLNEIFPKSPRPCLLWTIFDRFRMFRSFPFEKALVQHTRISTLCLVQVGLPIMVFILTPLAQATIQI